MTNLLIREDQCRVTIFLSTFPAPNCYLKADSYDYLTACLHN